MRNSACLLLVIGLLAPTGGCLGVRMPQLVAPGTASYQRYQALRFDPYPDSELGPSVVGGRPRGYQKPAAQLERLRRFGPPIGGWYRPVGP